MHKDKLYTNSCIQLSIPFEYQQSGNITCTWSSQPWKHHPTTSKQIGAEIQACPLSQFITYQHRTSKDIQRAYYICSPLDLDNYIHVRVQQNQLVDNTILEQLKYGPVQLQPDLFKQVFVGQWNNIEIILNKTIKKQANIFVVDAHNTSNSSINASTHHQHQHNSNTNNNSHCHSQSHNNSNNNSNSGSHNNRGQINIILRIQSFQFCIQITQQMAKSQRQSFQKSPFFKIYDNEPNAVGILISYQISQVMQKMKQLQIFYHFGHYLKIYFDNRICRDIFMCSVMAQTNLGIQKLKQFSAKLHELQSNKKSQKLPARTNSLSDPRHSPKQLLKIPKIQSTIRASQIVGFEFLNNQDSENQLPKVHQNILEDIYNILYTPINKIEPESPNVQSQSITDNNFYSATNIAQQSIEINQDELEQKLQKMEISNGKMEISELPNQSNMNLTSDKNININSPIRKRRTLDFTPSGSYNPHHHDRNYVHHAAHVDLHNHTHPHKQLTTTEHAFHHNHNNNNEFTNFHQQFRQIDLLQKINMLTKLNEKLVRENKYLREQNESLRRTDNSSQRASQLNKMIEIKAMVELMAKKLANLQSNKMHSPRKQLNLQPEQMNNGRNKQLEGGNKNVGNNKRFWSPRAHDLLVKNIKQKQSQKQKTNQNGKTQLERQKSLSYFNQNQTNTSRQYQKQKSTVNQQNPNLNLFMNSNKSHSPYHNLKVKEQKTEEHKDTQGQIGQAGQGGQRGQIVGNQKNYLKKNKQLILKSTSKDVQLGKLQTNISSTQTDINASVTQYRNVFGST